MLNHYHLRGFPGPTDFRLSRVPFPGLEGCEEKWHSIPRPHLEAGLSGCLAALPDHLDVGADRLHVLLFREPVEDVLACKVGAWKLGKDFMALVPPHDPVLVVVEGENHRNAVEDGYAEHDLVLKCEVGPMGLDRHPYVVGKLGELRPYIPVFLEAEAHAVVDRLYHDRIAPMAGDEDEGQVTEARADPPSRNQPPPSPLCGKPRLWHRMVWPRYGRGQPPQTFRSRPLWS